MRFLGLCIVGLYCFAMSACGGNDLGAGFCVVDCSQMYTGKIDVRNYGNISKEDCTKKGQDAGCTTKWTGDGNTWEYVY